MVGGLTPLQRSTRCILLPPPQPQPTGQYWLRNCVCLTLNFLCIFLRNFCTRLNNIDIPIQPTGQYIWAIYRTRTYTTNPAQSGTKSNNSKGIFEHSSEVQNLSLASRYCYVSYLGHPHFYPSLGDILSVWLASLTETTVFPVNLIYLTFSISSLWLVISYRSATISYFYARKTTANN